MANPFAKLIEDATGRTVTSGFRSQEEQNQLVARGVTKATRSSHSSGTVDSPGAVDLRGDKPGQEAVIRQQLEAAGHPVSRVIFERGGPNQGTGPHYHVEFGSKRSADRNAGQSITTTSIPASMASGGGDSSVAGGNPFKLDGEVTRRAQGVEDALANQEAFLTDRRNVFDAMQLERRTKTEANVAAKREVIQSAIAADKQAVEQLGPTQQYLDKLAAQRIRIATMNPLERGLRGIFDLNYNDKYLRGVAQEVQSALDTQTKQYTLGQTLRENYLKDLDHQMEADNAEFDLTRQEFNEDSAMTNMAVSHAQVSLAALGQANTAHDNLIQSQAFRINNALEGMTPGDVAAAIENAKGSGQAVVNGVVIPMGQLVQKQQLQERQDLAFESAKLSIQSQRMDIAEKQMAQFVDTLSPTQLNEIAANGGMYKGMQIPSSILTQGLLRANQRQQLTVAAVMDRSAPKQIEMGVRQFNAEAGATLQRYDSLGIGKQMIPRIGAIRTELASATMDYANLVRQGMGGGAAATQAAKAIQTARAKMETLAEGVVAQYAGGNKNTQAVLKSYVMGEPVSADAASQMFIDFNKEGGMPVPMTTTPAFQAAYDSYSAAITAVDAEAAAKGEKLNKTERNKRISDRARATASDAINKANFTEFFGSLPQAAKQFNNGFGDLPNREWQMIQYHARQDAYEQAASRLGVTPSEIEAYHVKGVLPQSVPEKSAKDWKQRAAPVIGSLPTWEAAGILKHLDNSSIAKPGFRPSAAYVEFITSPAFTNLASLYQQKQGEFSLGDFAAAGLRGTGLASVAAGYANQTQQIAAAQDRAMNGGGLSISSAYNTSPAIRAKAIIATVPGLNEREEGVLYRAVTQGISPDQMTKGVMIKQTNDAIRSRVMDAKFDDPELERIRRTAAKSWDAQAEMLDKAGKRITSNDLFIGADPSAFIR